MAAQSTTEPNRPGELPLDKLRALANHLFAIRPSASREQIVARIHFEGLDIKGVPTAKHVVKRSGFDLAVQSQLQKTADKFLKTKN